MIRKYGIQWSSDAEPLAIELACIRKGGRWMDGDDVCGAGLFEHYKNAWALMWPKHDFHRWIELGLKRICENEITTLMGSGDSGKTFLMAKFVLTDWWADPRRTLWMVSSTDRRGAELRVWGKIKQLFNEARQLHPWLDGFVLESRACIVADDIADDQSEARILTQGIIFIPCKQGTTWLGLGPYAGIKPPENGKMGHAGDEVSLMHPTFLDAYANWYGKANFKGLLAGNPGDLEDPLCTAGEPEDGWDGWKDNGKTQEWRSKFYGAWVIAYDGRDTPNNDNPRPSGKVEFPYLIGPKKLKAVKEQYGENDWHWWNQCVGKPCSMSQTRRVVTRQLCESKGAFDDVIWLNTESITQVVAMDAAYGGVGGDECVIRRAQFGKDVNGHEVFVLDPDKLVPVSVRNPEPPEDQITVFCKQYCESLGCPPSHFFFDGRSTLAVAMSRGWSPEVNVVDFGGTASSRPVSQDEFKWEGDTQTKQLRRADEAYFNFVTELWFSIYYLIHSKQLRRLDKETARELYQRTWDMKGNRKQVEPKSEMKLRTNRSPDHADTLATLLEGARRLGFQIELLKGNNEVKMEDFWLERELEKHREWRRSGELIYNV